MPLAANDVRLNYRQIIFVKEKNEKEFRKTNDINKDKRKIDKNMNNKIVERKKKIPFRDTESRNLKKPRLKEPKSKQSKTTTTTNTTNTTTPTTTNTNNNNLSKNGDLAGVAQKIKTITPPQRKKLSITKSKSHFLHVPLYKEQLPRQIH